MNAIKERFEVLLRKVNSSDGIIVSIGISALVTGILVDIFVVRLVCLLVVVSSTVLVYALVRVKRFDATSRETSVGSQPQSQEESDDMKKLFFDDFESRAGEKSRPGEEYDAPPRRETHASPMLVQTMGSLQSTAQPKYYVPAKDVIPPAVREFQISDFFDIDSEIYRGDPEPRTEFNFLLHKVLVVVKDVLFANSVVFFWANREKQQMVMEARVSESPNFIPTRRYAIGEDLVAQVASSGKPELVTAVNPMSERELLPYYAAPVGIRAFVGVPVYFSPVNQGQAPSYPVGVIAVDSKVEDAFGRETLALLGQFTKLISALIKSYTDKYDLLLDSELLRSIRRLQERVRNDFSLDTILQSLSEETSKLVSWDHISIVLYEEKKHAWLVKKVTNRAPDGYITAGQIIEFPESIVGLAIKNNTHGVVDDIDPSPGPRFHSSEKIDRKGSFVAVPISSLNKCYGSLNVESRDKYNFSRQDIEMLYRLAENAAFALEILYMEEVINEYVIVDDTTGVYSRKFFVQRLEEELRRAEDMNADLSLLFLTIDKSNDIVQRYGHDGFERVLLTISRAIRQCIRPYDVVGRYDSSRFVVALIDTASNEAYLWAEKIRKSIAGLVIPLDGRSFSVTISIGVTGALEGVQREELLNNATTVLNRAVEGGGNAVRVF